MPAATFAAHIRRGREEEWRRFVQEVTEERFEEYEDLRRRLGLGNESLWLLRDEAGETAVAYLEAEDPKRVAGEFAASKVPFDLWLKEHLRRFHGGVRASVVRRPGAELIFAYPQVAADGDRGPAPRTPAKRPAEDEPHGAPGAE